MKQIHRRLALALILLLLTGCAAEAPISTPAISPTGPLTTPVPALPQDEVARFVDWLLEGEEVHLMCWLSNGSGPTSVDLAPYKEEVRTLFSQLEWSYREGRDTAVHEGSPADWGYYLQSGNSSINFFGGTQHDHIDIAYDGLKEKGPLSFAAVGASGLAMALVDLHPGPWIRFCLAEAPAEGITNDQELAEAYAAAFEQFYLDSDHITGFELTDLEVLDPATPDSLYRSFRMAFSVTPADPTDPGWGEGDELYTFDYEMHLLLDEDNMWRCDWFQR